MLENIGIIPARGGSKGVKLKNLRPLNNIPLIAYGILCSIKSPSITITIVSTDSEQIADVAKSYGAEVIMRPPEFATDEAPTELAMQHVVSTLEDRGKRIGNIALLQCTCPFRLVADVENGFGLLGTGNGDAVMSVSSVPDHFHPYWIKKIIPEGYLSSLYHENDISHNILETKRYWRRQDLPGKYYWKNGALYIFSRESLMKYGHRYGTKCSPLVIDGERLVNIDSVEDFTLAEKLLSEKNIILDFLDE